jgi:hypothetical protein
MGPVEIVFIAVWLLFGVIGLVRGVWKELGVTVMLFIGLLFLQVIAGPFAKYWTTFLGYFTTDPSTQKVISNMIAVAVMLIVAFISYQGEVLTYPGKGDNWFFSLGTGLLNGWLLAGSIWYYFNAAGWPGGFVNPPFSQYYNTMVKLLPPAVLPWQALILLVVFMMVLRVLK